MNLEMVLTAYHVPQADTEIIDSEPLSTDSLLHTDLHLAHVYVKPEFYLDTIVFWQKVIFAGKNLFLPVQFLPWNKPFFSTDWKKPALVHSGLHSKKIATCHYITINTWHCFSTYSSNDPHISYQMHINNIKLSTA